MKMYFCRICGLSEEAKSANDHDWDSDTRCQECKKNINRKNPPLKDKLPKSVWGYVCEDYVSWKSKGEDVNLIPRLAKKYATKDIVIRLIINQYLGIGENPLLIYFTPQELEPSKPVLKESRKIEFKAGEMVRILKAGDKYRQIKTIHKVIETKKGPRYRLKMNGNSTYSPYDLEPVLTKEIRNFNI